MQLNITEQQVWLSTTPVDFRKSIDGLSAVVQESLQGNPQIGIYLFFNKSKDKVKILGWHKNGFVLVYKRLERGKFTTVISDDGSTIISTKQLSWLLAGLDWVSMSDWDELEFSEFH